MAMMSSLGGVLGGGRDMVTGERWEPPPLTAAQRQLERVMCSGGADEMQAVLEANPGMDVNFFTDEGGFTLLHMAVRGWGSLRGAACGPQQHSVPHRCTAAPTSQCTLHLLPTSPRRCTTRRARRCCCSTRVLTWTFKHPPPASRRWWPPPATAIWTSFECCWIGVGGGRGVGLGRM